MTKTQIEHFRLLRKAGVRSVRFSNDSAHRVLEIDFYETPLPMEAQTAAQPTAFSNDPASRELTEIQEARAKIMSQDDEALAQEDRLRALTELERREAEIMRYWSS
jgi:hypothetical protein